MKKYKLLTQICSFLILIFSTPCYGQTDGYMFCCGIRDKAGNLWFSNVGNGVYRYDAVTGAFTNFTKEDGLNDNNIGFIFEDKAGYLWFGTEKGVCRYDPSAQPGGGSFTDVSAKAGLCKYYINCILEDRNGIFWFGTNGYGVCSYNPLSGAVTNFTKEQGLGSDAVQCMLEDKAGNLWCGERAGGVSRYDMVSGRFTKVSGGCFSNQMMDIIEDKAGNIWFANLYTGVCRYDPATGVYTHFTQADGFCNDTVTCIYEDKKGTIWFGCGSNKFVSGVGGLCRYDPSAALRPGGKSFTSFGRMHGLASTDVWTIIEENDGTMWVGTRGGLFRYHSPSGRFIDYTHKVNSKN